MNKRNMPLLKFNVDRSHPVPRTGRAIAYDQLQPCVDTVAASPDLSAGRPCERRDPSVSAIALIAAARTLVSAPEPRPLSLLRPGVMGPCVRRDDSSKRYVYENSICDNPALT